MTHRQFWTLIHRYAGLAMALFVSVAGLTGTLLAFGPEIERAISPHLFPAPPVGGVHLGVGELLARAETLVPHARADGVYLGDRERARVNMHGRPDPVSGQSTDLPFNELYLSPYTGEELGRSTWGRISQGWFNFMPLVLEIHYSMLMGQLGAWFFGIVAVVWTLDCFIGLYLTLPSMRAGAAWTQLPRRWTPAWRIKRGSSRYRLHFDLHRAGGLWMWALLGLFAWSGVLMNLANEVYFPVMEGVATFSRPEVRIPLRPVPVDDPRLSWQAAQAQAEQLMAEQATRFGFTVVRPERFYLDRLRGVYFYDVHSSLDFQDRRGATTIYFDADTGELRLVLLPRGQWSGNTITNWLIALHEANVFGLPYRLIVAMLGLAIAALSVTGVLVWWRKRLARRTIATNG